MRSHAEDCYIRAGMLQEAERVLSQMFGHAAFRPLQRDAVGAFLEGRDVTLVLPTGAGKSACFQVPAVVLARAGRGPTLVVSPLIALM
ncbi:MAG TPA: DEAD/DEAH box helicase, partial [Polyangiaceae bacterium]|nr:DEAD/DEAH box helicase [Polyangiaceae bacterium]